MSNISDVNVSIPSFSTYIPNDSLILSSTFSDIITELCNEPLEETMAHSLKGGENVPEVRNIENPKLVTEWLLYACIVWRLQCF